MKNPHERLQAWRNWTGRTVRELAKELGCSRPLLSLFLNGHRVPGRAIANRIELASALWPEGPIRSLEWDAEPKAMAAITPAKSAEDISAA